MTQQTYDIWIVGHLTRDSMRLGDVPAEEAPGGVPYYAALAYQSLGLNSAVVTRLAASDDDICVGSVRAAGVHVLALPSPATTVFENSYGGPHEIVRTQRVTSLAAPFTADDVADIRGRYVHLGPLTAGDMPLAVFNTVRRNFADVVLDVQGCLRRVEADGAVARSAWEDMAAVLAGVNILKASRAEAALMTGREEPADAARALAGYGPREVIVTLGAAGSVVWCAGIAHEIPAVPARAAGDPTGCGDTYLAAYVALRRDGAAPDAAAAFASAAASLKLEVAGALGAARAEVRARLAAFGVG